MVPCTCHPETNKIIEIIGGEGRHDYKEAAKEISFVVTEQTYISIALVVLDRCEKIK